MGRSRSEISNNVIVTIEVLLVLFIVYSVLAFCDFAKVVAEIAVVNGVTLERLVHGLSVTALAVLIIQIVVAVVADLLQK